MESSFCCSGKICGESPGEGMLGASIGSSCCVVDGCSCIWSWLKSRPREFGEDALAMDVSSILQQTLTSILKVNVRTDL